MRPKKQVRPDMRSSGRGRRLTGVSTMEHGRVRVFSGARRKQRDDIVWAAAPVVPVCKLAHTIRAMQVAQHRVNLERQRLSPPRHVVADASRHRVGLWQTARLGGALLQPAARLVEGGDLPARNLVEELAVEAGDSPAPVHLRVCHLHHLLRLPGDVERCPRAVGAYQWRGDDDVPPTASLAATRSGLSQHACSDVRGRPDGKARHEASSSDGGSDCGAGGDCATKAHACCGCARTMPSLQERERSAGSAAAERQRPTADSHRTKRIYVRVWVPSGFHVTSTH